MPCNGKFGFLLFSLSLIFSACQNNDVPPGGDNTPDDPVLANQMEVAFETPGSIIDTSEHNTPTAMETAPADPWAAVDPSGQSLTLWHEYSGIQKNTFETVVADFNKSNQWGITVQAQAKESMGEIYKSMLAAINTPGAPNLVLAYPDQAAVYALYGGLADMAGLENSARWGLTGAERLDYFNASLHAGLLPLADNARVGFPFSSSMQVLYFNKDWLTELGYNQPPQTPEEFKEIACRAAEQPFSKVEDENSMGYGFSISASQLANWTFSHNGDIFDYDNGRYSFDNEASIQAMRFLQDLILRGCAAATTDRYANQAEFASGNLLFNSGTSAGFPFIEREIDESVGFEWGMTAVPFITSSPIQNVHNTSFSIPSTYPEAELASWLVLKHLTSPEIQSIWVQSSAHFPVRKSARTGLNEYYNQNPALSSVYQHLEDGKYEPAVPGYQFVRELVSESMNAIFIGEDAGLVLSELTAEANTILQDHFETPLATLESIPVIIPDE